MIVLFVAWVLLVAAATYGVGRFLIWWQLR